MKCLLDKLYCMLIGLGAQTGGGQTSDREDADLDQECSPCPPKLGQRTGKSL